MRSGRSAERARRQHVFHFLGLQNLRASQASVSRPTSNDQRENHFTDARAQKCRERDGQQDSGERKKRVDQDDVHQAVEPSSAIAGKRADRKSDNPAPNTTLTPTSIEMRAP